MSSISRLAIAALLLASTSVLRGAEAEPEPKIIGRVVAVEGVCVWPNLTLLPDGTVIAVFHNQPSHGQQEGDVDCWASRDGLSWEKRSTVTRHDDTLIACGPAICYDLLQQIVAVYMGDARNQ